MTEASQVDHRANRLLAAMEPEDFARLEPHLEFLALPRGKVLYEAGEVIRHAYFPHDCVVSVLAVMRDGHLVEMAVFGREAVCGLVSAFISRRSHGRYVVQLAGAASRIRVDRLKAALDQSQTLRDLFRRFVEALLVQTFQTVACNAVHSVEARCCRWILSTHDRVDRDVLPLTHEFLAEMLGVQRSTISVVARNLQSAGLIGQSRGHIEVTDRSGLEENACECYDVVRRSYERLLPMTYAPKAPAPRASVVSAAGQTTPPNRR
jgi:CRP-like cAMP-binding protein